MYDEKIDENIRIKNENNIDSKTQKEKENNTKDKTKEESENNENLIKTDYASNKEEKLENSESDSSKNIEQETINKIKNTINSHDQANNETFNDTIKLLTQQFEEFQKKSTKDKQELLEQIEELQKKSTTDKKELTQKIEELQEESTKDKKELKNLKAQMNEMSTNILNLNEKLDLLVLINNLICQRDTYKIALEELIKFLTERYGITINDINTNEPIWKKTKAICILLSKSDTIEKDNCQKIINGLKSLLFCKDYFNCIVHPKSAFANEKESSSELKNDLPILSIACYKSMKELTQKFFDSVVNSIGDFKKVNSLLLKKIKFWTDAKDFNYDGYFDKEILNTGNIMCDFKFVINFIEENNIVEKIEESLDN